MSHDVVLDASRFALSWDVELHLAVEDGEVPLMRDVLAHDASHRGWPRRRRELAVCDSLFFSGVGVGGALGAR
jgi:hypothetical protein